MKVAGDNSFGIGLVSGLGELGSVQIIDGPALVTVAVPARTLSDRHASPMQDIDVDLTFRLYRGSDLVAPLDRPLRLRLRVVSDRLPPLIGRAERVRSSVESLGESERPLVVATLHVDHGGASTSYDGPPAQLRLRAEAVDAAVGRGPAPHDLQLREPGANETERHQWTPVGAFARPLPLTEGALVLECALPPGVLRSWLKAGTGREAVLPLSLVPEIEGGDANAALPAQTVEVPVRVEGDLPDVLAVDFAGESKRVHLPRDGRTPVLRFAAIRTARRQGNGRSDLGLDEIEFDIAILSGTNWVVEAGATLIDLDEPEQSASETIDAGARRLVTEAEAPTILRVGLPTLAARLLARDRRLEHARLEVALTLRREPEAPASGTDRGERTARIEIPISVHRGASHWLVCIDFGASAVAVGVTRVVQGETAFAALLPLGDWLAIADPNHPERESRRTKPGVLMPSYVGLSSDMHFRARFDPASLGDFRAMLDKGAEHRRDLLGYHYDVSVPFPSSQALADAAAQVVFDLKRALAQRSSGASAARVPRTRRNDGADVEIDPADLFCDALHELGAYVTPRALRHALRGSSPEMLRDFHHELRADDEDDRVGVVLTHPFGLQARELGVYRAAGRRFLAGLLGRPADHPDLGRIVAVPEALAAARYGLWRLLSEGRIQGSAPRLVCLDIGASTYDVTVIDCEIDASAESVAGWQIRGHFGLLVGGVDLDRALARRVLAIIRAASGTPGIRKLFEIETNLKTAPGEITTRSARAPLPRQQSRFLEALQTAKRELAERILGREGDYGWKDEHLLVEIGTAAQPSSQNVWPVGCIRPEIFSRYDVFTERLAIAGEPDAELLYGRNTDNTAFIRLSIAPQAFDARAAVRSEGPDIGALTDALGRQIPELAALVASPDESDRPVWWIVTGRTALWPGIFGGILDVVLRRGDHIPGKPLRPAEMKEAVLEGALRLAEEMHLPLTSDAPPTIGVQTHGPSGSSLRFLSPDRPETFTDAARRTLVRMLPGLDRLEGAALDTARRSLEAAGIKGLQDLGEIARRGDGPVRVASEATPEGLVVTVRDDRSATGGRRFGPFREDRIYG